MGISLVKFNRSNGDSAVWGVLRDDKIYPLKAKLQNHKDIMKLYFEQRDEFNAAVSQEPTEQADISFLSPISQDVQLFCQGLNYASHREEGGLQKAAAGENLIFMKAPSSICGPNDDIVRPQDCQLLDYEIELGLVLKQDIAEPCEILDADLQEYIGGMVLANDVSSRDHQFGATAMQWFKGKSFRTFCPMGPVLYLLDKEDFSQLEQMQLTLKLNGEVKQDASTDLLIHKPAATLTEISSYANLNTGDCLLTGTPGGVLLNINLKTALGIMFNLKNDSQRRDKVVTAQLAQQQFLQPGDRLELEIKSADGQIQLGSQQNLIV